MPYRKKQRFQQAHLSMDQIINQKLFLTLSFFFEIQVHFTAFPCNNLHSIANFPFFSFKQTVIHGWNVHCQEWISRPTVQQSSCAKKKTRAPPLSCVFLTRDTRKKSIPRARKLVRATLNQTFPWFAGSSTKECLSWRRTYCMINSQGLKDIENAPLKPCNKVLNFCPFKYVSTRDYLQH